MIFPLFHIEIEGKCGWIIGGAKGYVAPPPLKLLGGGAWPPPPGPPSSYAYVLKKQILSFKGPISLPEVKIVRGTEQPGYKTSTAVICDDNISVNVF